MALGLVLFVAAALVAIVFLDRGAPPRATATDLAPSDTLSLGETAALFETHRFLTASDSAAFAEGAAQSAGVTPYFDPAALGLTTATTREFNSKATSSSDTTGAEGWDTVEWNKAWTRVDSTTLEVGASPGLTGMVMQHKHTANQTAAGSTPQGLAQIGLASRNWTKLLIQYWYAHSSNFYGEPSGTNKQWFVDTNLQPSAFFQSTETKNTQTSCRFAQRFQGALMIYANTRNYANVSGASDQVSRGEWHLIEDFIELNTAGAANGRRRTAVDGVLTHDYNNVQFFSAAHKFGEVSIEPTWGGNTANFYAPWDFYLWFDRAILSGA